MKPKFIEGGRKNGHDPKVLEKIWTDWEKFASLCVQQIARYLLLLGSLSDSLSESELPVGIHGGCHEPKFVQHYRYHEA